MALFPLAAIGGGLIAATTGGGAVLGAVAGHAAAGMSPVAAMIPRSSARTSNAGHAGPVVVGVSDMGAKIEQAMKNAAKLERKELQADPAAIEADAKAAQTDAPASTSGEAAAT